MSRSDSKKLEKNISVADEVLISPDDRTPLHNNKQPPLIQELLHNNKVWAKEMIKHTPDYFSRLANQQSPQILWFGCSDSRVPANQILNLAPGEVFVHRNIANVFVHTDFNALSVLQYAVEVLKVRHIIVCGHYGCGGIAAACGDTQFGLIDNWLRHIKDLYSIHRHNLEAILTENPSSPNLTQSSEEDRKKKKMFDLLCELNVVKSLHNICHTTIVLNAWARGQPLSVNGFCYRLTDGIMRDLNLVFDKPEDLEHKIFQTYERKEPSN
jgi:carbonic anhydrase